MSAPDIAPRAHPVVLSVVESREHERVLEVVVGRAEPADPWGMTDIATDYANVRSFLESTPLFTPLVIVPDQPRRGDMGYPAGITFRCRAKTCRAEPATTWKAESEKVERSAHVATPSYTCALCEMEVTRFWILETYVSTQPFRQDRIWTRVELRKVGQWPAPVTRPSAAIDNALNDEDADLYRKALTSLSQGYGIGAAAYFRRILEHTIDDLLVLVREAAEATNDAEAFGALAEARKSRAASDRLALVVDHVPASLRPGGVNPLALLYGAFSTALHDLDESAAVELAQRYHDAFSFVHEVLREQTRRARELAATLKPKVP